ncbi:MAG: HyaD/HybD family hydrogenase maturation endopeptidase [Roseiflexus sp.]|nr:HyaD/HybD family hydrogenase maturation endopeptidase [Roseiflexus sp.]MCS7288725.1 HyaD/HybD family hydrogenase maturation endopeptidase [Roseiflexus sp.]MDW8147269.1 HyaD/HybD family hydrogenase maturation endopeptidase [Roseiflexaceae bacterium]
MPAILVLGLGNIIMRDEGLGVRACERLIQRYRLPDGVTVLDGGTLGLDLLPHLEGVTNLIILDAINAGLPPGAIVRLENEQIPQTLALKMSMHQVGLQELLAVLTLRGQIPPHIVLLGMEPLLIEPGLDLSEPVQVNLDALVEAVAAELRSWGVPVSLA